MGRIISQECILSAGTGTTIDPILGSQADPATGAWKVENATAAAAVFNVPATGIPYGPEITSFFHRAVPDNVAADHTITTNYYVLKG